MNDSPPGGNGNGRFDPGEEGGLLLTLRNAGNAGATNVQARIRSGHELFTFTDSLAAYGTVPAGSTRVNTDDPFSARVDARIPIETPVTCSLFVTGDGDYCDTLRVTLVVGELQVYDPIPDGPRRPALYWAYEDVDTLFPESPEFEWVEIGGIGTRLDLGDDQTVQVTLPSAFGPFVFYGREYGQVSICGNGWLGPGYTDNRVYNNGQLPNGVDPTMLAVVWDDLYPPTSGSVWWHHDVDNHRFIVQWDSMPYYASRDIYDWFQVIIYDTTMAAEDGNSEFVYQYLTANGLTSATVGSNDSIGVIGIQALLDGVYHRAAHTIEAGRALKFTTDDPTTGIAEKGPTRLPRPLGTVIIARPNPFSRSTALAIEPAQPGEVALSVYDNNGRLVRSLAVGHPAGTRSSLSWDGCDDQGRAVAPGMYFVRLNTDETDAWAKVVVSR